MTAKAHSSGNSHSGVHPWTQDVGLKKLCTLLRNEGDRVLSGSSAFTLTTEVLTRLNHDCRRHSITESDIAAAEISPGGRSFLPLASRLRAQQAAARVKEEWSGHVQFIKDFMLSTPSLKLIRYSGTLSSPISLHRFGNLTCLQLRKVPIHMVEGLHRLRGVLVSVTVYRSVDKVKDLLEFCGGDMTAAMVWPQLKYVSFMFNSISALDDSLRLLTHVEVLDLSHNSLETCDKFLETLNIEILLLDCVNIGMLLLDWVEVLTALQELDLGENCVSDHSRLNNLASLVRLKQLQLDGNPVFYHKQHRLLTVACLALTAVSLEFELDKKRLTASEISKAAVKRCRASHLSYIREVTARSHTPDSGYYVSASSDIGTENESENSVVTYTSKKKGRRKRLKARHMEISDAEHSEDISSSRDVTPGTTPHPQSLEQQLKASREEAMHTQREVEDLRRHYGSNWLQAIEDRDIFNKKKAALVALTVESSDLENTESDNGGGTKFIIGSKSNSGFDKKSDTRREDDKHSTCWSNRCVDEEVIPTDDDLYLTDTGIRDTHNPIMAAIARLAAGHSSDSTDEGNKSGMGVAAFSSLKTEAENSESEVRHSFIGVITNHSRYVLTNAPSFSEFEASDNIDAEIGSKNDLVTNHKTGENDTRPISPSNVPQMANKFTGNNGSLCSQPAELSSQSEALAPKTVRDLNTSATGKAKIGFDCTPSQTSPPSSPDLVDEEEEEVIEPVFATLSSQANEMIILSLTASFLVEKNIQGKVTEKLQLASLTGMDWRKVTRPLNQSESSADVTRPDDHVKLLRGEAVDMAESFQLDLKFDYVRRNRQSRSYIVDATDGNVILGYLQPFLESREDREKAKIMVPMQCLKCNRTFLKSELIQQRSQLPTSGSSKDIQSLQELLNKTTMLCPKCGSSLIIELQQPPSTDKSTGSAMSTPVGSYASLTGGYMDQVKRPSSLARKKSLDMTTAVRDRTSALITDTRVVHTSMDQKITEKKVSFCV
ncbi:unnamed protein product [Candidula unifasciata]|uniref:Serine/threonine-protein kinase 11-interacting protein n=1 Tax=Candidula unifasciata TaxID=100452 RepID=A0A8S4A3H5_9EUPU|nr:unnamed protein product [Candidula unifasciata]